MFVVLFNLILSNLQSLNIIPDSQFGFRAKHSTIHQIHRLTDLISSSFEKNQYCPGVFLDVSQAFDRVWHKGLLYKLKQFLPAPYFLLIKSYLENRTFVVRQSNFFSSYYRIQAGVPQGSDLSPDLFNIYTADMPKSTNTTMALYADDTAIISPGNDTVPIFHLFTKSPQLNWKLGNQMAYQNKPWEVGSHKFHTQKNRIPSTIFSRITYPKFN